MKWPPGFPKPELLNMRRVHLRRNDQLDCPLPCRTLAPIARRSVEAFVTITDGRPTDEAALRQIYNGLGTGELVGTASWDGDG